MLIYLASLILLAFYVKGSEITIGDILVIILPVVNTCILVALVYAYLIKDIKILEKVVWK